MDFPAWYFASIWLTIGFYFSFIGIEALNRSTLSKSVSPLIMSLFKHFLAASFCHSATYSLALRPKLNIPLHKYFAWISFAVFPLFFNGIVGDSFQWYFPVYSLLNLAALLFYFLPSMREFMFEDHRYQLSIGVALLPLFYYYPPLGEPSSWYVSMFVSNCFIHFNLTIKLSEEGICLLMHVAALAWVFFYGGIGPAAGDSRYFPFPVILIGFLTAAVSAAISGDERFGKLMPEAAIAAAREDPYFMGLKRWIKENGKVIEFAIGMAGTILFQNFFRPAAFEDVVAFLYLAVAWLANLGLVLAKWDLGIFNFFLSNVIVGCTVSQFGLRGTTWLAYAACVALFLLRQKLDALTVVEGGGVDREPVVVWRDHEKTTELQNERCQLQK